MKNKDIKKAAATALLLSTLLTTGCGATTGDYDNNLKPEKNSIAIIINRNVATIVKINYYMGDRYNLTIKLYDDSKIHVSFNNVIILDNIDDIAYAEELAYKIVGEDGEVNYYNPENVQRKLK